ncbi:alpha/beta hydrolase [Diaphorobacter sp. JS3051]|jgi:acetyl esterase/lipase|uniref:alpha/beta hydrolase n=1 Tax=Diaphorobacter sp. JS3051 TaxID=2792224 RepID=UPI0018CB53E0|nr:alpha/beta hydrolase [Diaphorobacter sp. JS3051]QPN29751.1 alpha/beta hydrolase [Diaphorobacter sp. JS3051]
MTVVRDFAALPAHERDAAYDNTRAVHDSARQLRAFDERSGRMAALGHAQLDIRYGPSERQVFDFFPGNQEEPTLLFIHGGYWQMRHKNTFRFIAEGANQHGLHVALLGYTLAPQSSLRGIVEQVGMGIAAVASHARHEGGSGKILLCGWSAGGHLAAMALASPDVVAGLGVSGIYDLEPIRHTYLNQALGLDAGEAQALSPIALPACGKPFVIAHGAAELPHLQAQSTAFAAYRQLCPGAVIAVPGADHFSILNALAAPQGLLLQALITTAANHPHGLGAQPGACAG